MCLQPQTENRTCVTSQRQQRRNVSTVEIHHVPSYAALAMAAICSGFMNPCRPANVLGANTNVLGANNTQTWSGSTHCWDSTLDETIPDRNEAPREGDGAI
jgi:hypothetical protein